jgi:tRNA threonylcarbamoyladenosine biosynthesis protein TsaE
MTRFCFDSPDPEDTARVAEDLGRAIGEEGLVLGLVGPLGSGKTVFVKGLAEGLGIDPRLVSSPTFVLAQQYPIVRETSPNRAPAVLHHVDLYRLESEDELESMGFFDLFGAGCVLAIEWADRFPTMLGPDRLVIEWDGAASRMGGAPGRTLCVEAYGARAEQVMMDWRERLGRRARWTAPDSGTDSADADPDAGAAAARRGRAGDLGVALLLLGLAAMRTGQDVGTHLGWASEAPACAAAVSLEEDAWGTRRVACGPGDSFVDRSDASEGEASTARPQGIGGVLFGESLDLERATAIQLEALPHLGPQRARAIVAAREQEAFESVAALQRVPGIGPRTVERLTPWLAVHQAPEMGGTKHRQGDDRG